LYSKVGLDSFSEAVVSPLESQTVDCLQFFVLLRGLHCSEQIEALIWMFFLFILHWDAQKSREQ
jgi:hypothetical protein